MQRAQLALIIGKTWPEPKTTGAGRRMMQIIHALNLDYEVHFASAAQKTLYSEDLDEYVVLSHAININDEGFDDWLTELRPSLVIFDRFHTEEQFGWRVKDKLPSALRILNMEDFHGLRTVRQSLCDNTDVGDKNRADLLAALRNNETVIRELAAIFRCDTTWVISDYEVSLLQNMGVPIDLLHYLPFQMSSFMASETSKFSFEKRKNFVFFGNFYHAPNLDAIKILRLIWPNIHKQLPMAELHVYGAYGENVTILQNLPKGMIYKGWAEHFTETISKYRLMLAPLRFGAGIKTKIIESMGCGLPVISTSVGWEGIFKDGKITLVADDKDDFSELAIQYYQSQLLWEQANNKSQEWMSRHKGEWDIQLIEKLKLDFAEMNALRAKNIFGSILHWNGNRTFKYMSKYIMAKNSKDDCATIK